MNSPNPLPPAPLPGPPTNDPTLSSIGTHVAAIVAGATVGLLTHKLGLDAVTANAIGSQAGDLASLAVGALVTSATHWIQAYIAKAK